jgi:hypothetical protein
MRAVQLGAALGARVRSSLAPADLAWADVVVLVKRAIVQADQVHAAKKPLVWDALDFWQQPAQNGLTEMQARALLADWIRRYRPTLTIGATQAMADACGGVYLPHHGHAGLVPTEARQECRVVAYEGSPAYLESWEPCLRDACAARGWSFVVNPPDLTAVDILVGLRGGAWDGWMCRQWKSGVKYVNAILAGRPVITQDTAAFHEIAPAGAVVQSTSDLGDALDRWADRDARDWAADRSRHLFERYALPSLAARYRAILVSII